MIKNILITGGAGFIGINTAKYYLNNNYNVTIFDNFSRMGTRENVKWLKSVVKKAPKIIESDIVKNKKKLNAAIANADVVFHFAAQVAVTTSIKNPFYDFKVNALGTLNVLEAIRKANTKPILLYSSTNKVYGDLESEKIKEGKNRYDFLNFPRGIKEDYPIHLKSPYGCSKGAADFYVQDYHAIYGLKTIVFRQSCIYGPRQFGIEDQGWVAWFIIALLSQKKITIYGNGKQVRDLLYIDDLVRAYDLAVTNIIKTNGKVYNIGGGKKNSLSIWLDLKQQLTKFFKKEITVTFTKARTGDQRIFIADITKAKEDFDWSPRVGLDEGIKKLFLWAKQNKTLFKPYLR